MVLPHPDDGYLPLIRVYKTPPHCWCLRRLLKINAPYRTDCQSDIVHHKHDHNPSMFPAQGSRQVIKIVSTFIRHIGSSRGYRTHPIILMRDDSPPGALL